MAAKSRSKRSSNSGGGSSGGGSDRRSARRPKKKRGGRGKKDLAEAGSEAPSPEGKKRGHRGSSGDGPSRSKDGARGPGPRSGPGGRVGPRGGGIRGRALRATEARDALPAGPKNWQQEASARTDKALTKWLTPPPRKPMQITEDLDVIPGAPKVHVRSEFMLDPWQQQAVDALNEGKHVIVDAPTTAGKTRVVESFFNQHLSDPTFRAVYTTPVKSLSNDKLREFRVLFGKENVGISTGDIKENLQAPIVVATLESYRNSLLGVDPDLGRTLVVFDEYHYIQDESRGSAWEEAMILSPPTCQVLLLSASVENADEFAEWVGRIHDRRSSSLIRVAERPVPLVDLVYHDNGWFTWDTLPEQLQYAKVTKDSGFLDSDEIAKRLAALRDDLSPVIVYAGRRLACEDLAFHIARALPPISAEALQRIQELLTQANTEVASNKFIPQPLMHLIKSKGVAFHHSGLPAPARIAVETLIKQGALRFCTATMGLSLGINFSVRSAVITDFDRPGDAGLVQYSASEVLQMLGRAGRRGRDQVGFSLWLSVPARRVLAASKREPCESRLRHDPATILGLVSRGYSLGAIESFYKKSFRRFKRRDFNVALLTNKAIRQRVGAPSLPCNSPGSAFSRFAYGEESPCTACPYRKPCHKIIKSIRPSDLASMHLHLHAIGALDDDEKLTGYGEIARFLPQSGGLLIAKLIYDNEISGDNVGKLAELLTALQLARFKEPGKDGPYRFPFDAEELEERLEEFYPLELFPEIYDTNPRRRGRPVIKEFNPDAGYIINQWIRGVEYPELISACASEFFSSGDLMNLLYRTGTYLQSIAQIKHPEISPLAGELRRHILRPPLEFALNIG